MHALGKTFRELRTMALTYPETREDHPWGETAIKVPGKTLLFMGYADENRAFSIKLEERLEFAVQYPFASPTRYAFGKRGRITATFSGQDEPPVDVLAAWIEESYGATAPRKCSPGLQSRQHFCRDRGAERQLPSTPRR